MKDISFIFNYVHLLYKIIIVSHKINLNRSGSHMDSSDRIKK